MPRARHADARADDAAPPRRAMPFVRRRPTEEEIARLEAASYAALDATLAAGTESESAFRSQFKTLRAPPRKPPPDAADAADAAAALAADALAVDAARREVDAAAERIYRASVGTIAAPDEAVEDASERATSGGRLSLPAVWKSNLQPDFNVRVCDSFDASSSTVLRELDESNRFVQKSAESTSM